MPAQFLTTAIEQGPGIEPAPGPDRRDATAGRTSKQPKEHRFRLVVERVAEQNNRGTEPLGSRSERLVSQRAGGGFERSARPESFSSHIDGDDIDGQRMLNRQLLAEGGIGVGVGGT